MKFTVQSGQQSMSVDTVDFEQAAILFVERLSKANLLDRLGDVISITVDATESWMRTDVVLRKIGSQELKVVNG